MPNPGRSGNVAYFTKATPAKAPQDTSPSADARTGASLGVDLSLPANIQSELESALDQHGFRLEMKDTNPLGQDNIRFHRICGTSPSGPSSAVLFYVNEERLRLKACADAYFMYSLCVRGCKKFKTGDADTLSLVVLTPEGTDCPGTWVQQINDFNNIGAAAEAECLKIPPPERWADAGVEVAMQYADPWIRRLGPNALREAAGPVGQSGERAITASTYGTDLTGQGPDASSPHVFISYSHKDGRRCGELYTALKPLESDGYKIWKDTSIDAGDEWEPTLKRALRAARVVVMLVTQDFIASDFIGREEVAPTIEAAKNKQKALVWVIWEGCAVKTLGLSIFQAGHQIDPPLAKLSLADRKEQLEIVRMKVKEILDRGRERSKQQPDDELFR
jgi:hypothetical protein